MLIIVALNSWPDNSDILPYVSLILVLALSLQAFLFLFRVSCNFFPKSQIRCLG